MAIRKLTSANEGIISSFENDPFVGHLSTPLTTSNIVKNYLNRLPAYQQKLSPLLRGINIGLSHGYFLLGPFVQFGPLRNTDVALFVGFLSAVSLIVLLSLALTLYSLVTVSASKDEFLTGKSAKEFISGFIIGGFSGVSLAYLLLNFFGNFS